MERDFTQLLKDYLVYGSKPDLKRIKAAWKFAKLAHTGQKRLSGEPFVTHPLEVAKILVSWKLDATSIVAALLHDSVEDGGATREDIVERFGEDVAQLVDGVTKVTSIRLKGSKEEEFVENLRKMLLVMARDLRVVLVKLADRLHNMRTLASLSPEKRVENSLETLEIYAPLAERLGVGKVKGELEDLAFPYAYPDEYQRVIDESRDAYKQAEKRIKEMTQTLLRKLAESEVEAEVHSRKKHYYSLWRKLLRPEIDWDIGKVADIIALRILTKTIPECYIALGIVHGSYKPVPNIGVSDFIAQPKPNGYQSIHTKVFGPGGKVVEVQIRTQKMHWEAEYGVAAHWVYTESKFRGEKDEVLEKEGVLVGDKLTWVKQLMEWQNQMKDSEEFLKAVKFDALSHRNFVFSPRGDVYDLPSGATPVDFAYMVHSDLGNYITGARVDGRVVALDYKLKSGQVVEIIKSKNPRHPSRDWLNFVVTTIARREIRRSLD